jgi:L-threonine kinase
MAGLGVVLNRPLSPAELARLACRVEPTDSIMFAELTMLAYRDTGRSQTIGPAPALPLLMLDPGLAVDTLSFNRTLNLAALRQLGDTTLEALDWLRQGALAGDAVAVGAAATLSAVSYQPLLFNPMLAQAQQWAKDTGAVGVVRAHSGTIAGLLYPPGIPLDAPARWLAKRFEGAITATQLTGGGYRLEPAPAARPVIAPVYQMDVFQMSWNEKVMSEE